MSAQGFANFFIIMILQKLCALRVKSFADFAVKYMAFIYVLKIIYSYGACFNKKIPFQNRNGT